MTNDREMEIRGWVTGQWQRGLENTDAKYLLAALDEARAMVESAYREGWLTGHGKCKNDPLDFTPHADWDHSKAKEALG